MRLAHDSGWLEGVRWVPSPNCDERLGSEVSLLIVHSISLPPGEYGGDAIDALFTNRLDPDAHPYFAGLAGLRVSAHALVRRDGQVVQYVPFHRRAWHAGESTFRGRSACNDFSIGVELEGLETGSFEEVQYQRLAELARVLMRRWPDIAPERIVGHSDVAPGRKRDPGPGFDWRRFHAHLRAGEAGPRG